MNSKPFYLCKTFYVALATALVGIAKYFGVEGVCSSVNDQGVEWIGAAIAILAARKVTTQPMHFVAPKDDGQ